MKTRQTLVMQLLACIGPRRRLQAAGVTALTLVVGALEVLGIGSIIPFIGVLVAPEKVWANSQVQRWAPVFGIEGPAKMAVFITAAFIVLTLVAGVFRLALLYASNRLVYAIGSDINSEVFRRSLYQPYKTHVDRNSASLVSGILLKSASVIAVIQAMMSMMTAAVILVAIVSVLLLADHVITLSALAIFGVLYGGIMVASRLRLSYNSRQMARNSDQSVKVLQEGFGGIRDVLLDGSQAVYSEAFRRADRELRRAKAENQFIAGSPRLALEAIGITAVAVFAHRLSGSPDGLSTLPMLGALAMGALRMLPQLQQAYFSWVQYVSNRALLRDVLALLNQPYDASLEQACPSPMPFREEIRLRQVSFRYAAAAPVVLDSLELAVPRGAVIGFVGTTGCGKSTLIDLILGLLEPTEGSVEIDGQSLRPESMRAWQKNIAHVPQTIFLKDASIAENIAFDVADTAIDMERVRACARRAQLDDFVTTLPEGYATYVGERGIRLSGGQRQRIGIARALYKNTGVLVLDEATSALDAETEEAVMRAIVGANSSLTIFIIAHRLTTLRGCDAIYRIEAGKAVAIESLEDLLSSGDAGEAKSPEHASANGMP